MSILFIVESPHKANIIAGILGKKYKVIATVGHIIDLDPSKMSIDIEHDFTPTYVHNRNSTNVINKIAEYAGKASDILLASDPDREGEMIAWSVANVLNIKNPKRITYTEVVTETILTAIDHPREIDYNLVNAQKTRRILDRIVGYELSPILMKTLGMQHLSAGRVQSVITRLIVDKEKEIDNYLSGNIPITFNFVGEFKNGSGVELTGKLCVDGESDAMKLLTEISKSKLIIDSIIEKPSDGKPSPPFSTASLLQTGASKLGFTIKKIMLLAQKLYESGFITYMRTDSVSLSEDAMNNVKLYILKTLGEKYYERRIYASGGKNTQEAHEAIRPTNVSLTNINNDKIDTDGKRLYSLIWKRTVASQMSSSKQVQQVITIKIGNNSRNLFTSHNERVTFHGFRRIYNIGKNINVNEFANVQQGDIMSIKSITAAQTYQNPPLRYSDSTLVKKINPENLNIGRPATTQQIITKIQERGYVKKSDVRGVEKDTIIFTMNSEGYITMDKSKALIGAEVNKYVPTELGALTNKFLVSNFSKIMDYKFTSDMEDELDMIAGGKISWIDSLRKFYEIFHNNIIIVRQNIKQIVRSNQRILGVYPNTSSDIVVAIAKYGPVVKMKRNNKTVYAPIKPPLTMDNITLVDAIDLLQYPKYIGKYEESDIHLQKGKFGLYLKYNGDNITVPNEYHQGINLSEAVRIINENNEKYLWIGRDGAHVYKIIDGKYGPYIKIVGQTGNIKVPPNVVISKDTSISDIKKLISEKPRRKMRMKTNEK